MMRFSQRMGFTPIRSALQIDSMDAELRNSIWNIIDEVVFEFMTADYGDLRTEPCFSFYRSFWSDFFKEPARDMPLNWANCIYAIRMRYEKYEWFRVYDFCEFVVQKFGNNEVVNLGRKLNKVLEREGSAYRFSDNLLVRVSDEIELSSISDAQDFSGKYLPVSNHINAAIRLMSDRLSPDYRNSIKESISAVEAMCRIATGNHKATLGDALKKFSDAGINIHPALNKSLNQMYGYTNDESGIRHSLLEESRLDYEDAKFMLVVCSAFVNFIRGKLI
ncbi:AbiJ-NTD4 domain-containing protein [Azospirillum sp. B506]|uniref:AbiJ-NTD4 domain-containing protein n=1 Tax=Azospirillum sp. B506 TaxID=137721 RepID=UPI00131F314B|nr:hypothetical protein [Azospirillum sp. B506]